MDLEKEYGVHGLSLWAIRSLDIWDRFGVELIEQKLYHNI